MSDSPTHETLKRAWRSGTNRADGGRHCPDDAEIYEAATGSADTDTRRRIVEHTARCGACAQSWRLAAELERARPDVVRAEERFRRPRDRFLNGVLAAAAAVVAVVGISLMLPRMDPGTPPPSAGSVLRGDDLQQFAVTGPSELRLGNGQPIVFTWEPVPEVRDYRVRLLDDELASLYSARVDTERLELPAGALSDVEDGETIFWFVQAELNDGSQRRSATATSTVRRVDD